MKEATTMTVPKKCPFCDRDVKKGRQLKDAVLYNCGLILQPKGLRMIAQGCEYTSQNVLTSEGENKWYPI